MTAVQRTEISAFGLSGERPLLTSAASRARETATADRTSEAAKLDRAAKDFESVLLRQMLSSLERTTKVGDKGSNVAGQQAYGSMIVETVANAIAESGGIGLATMLSKTIQQKASSQETRNSQWLRSSDGRGTPQIESQSVPEAGRVNFCAQGLPSSAVPVDEIRTSAAQITGQLADRRFR